MRCVCRHCKHVASDYLIKQFSQFYTAVEVIEMPIDPVNKIKQSKNRTPKKIFILKILY